MRSTIARDRAWLGLRLRVETTSGVFHECDLNASSRSLYRLIMLAHPAEVSSPDRAEPASTAADGAPLGPDSLTWKYLGDTRGMLLTQRAGVLQVMHPAIAAGLKDHSDFFENPLQRLTRSAGPILGVVYDQDGEATARWVRDQHPPIRGSDARGRRYHALDPETYYWAHATFFESQIATQELFGTPLTAAQKEQLYAESITWYARYGLTMRPVPRDYRAFERYWQRMFETVLEPTSLALAAVRPTRSLPAPHPALDGAVWAVAAPLLRRSGPWLTRCTLPLPAQEILRITSTRADELALVGLRALVHAVWPVMPRGLRRLPRASAGIGRHGGSSTARASPQARAKARR
jgi:uncharacterized protein (DUF2236 family)